MCLVNTKSFHSLPAAMAPGTFVYGPLMSFRVLEGLIYRVPKMLPAYLPGMTRLQCRGSLLPGVWPAAELKLSHFPLKHHDLIREYFHEKKHSEANSFIRIGHSNHHVNKVQGMVLKNLSPREIAILDWHGANEGFQRHVQQIVVGYDKNWNVEEASLYLPTAENLPNDANPEFWCFHKFCVDHLSDYLPSCTHSRSEYLQSLPPPSKYQTLPH